MVIEENCRQSLWSDIIDEVKEPEEIGTRDGLGNSLDESVELVGRCSLGERC